MINTIDLSKEGCKKALQYFLSKEFKDDCIREQEEFRIRYKKYLAQTTLHILELYYGRDN